MSVQDYLFNTDVESAADLYYEDYYLEDIQDAFKTLKYSDHGCEKINSFIYNSDDASLMASIMKQSSTSSSLRININCETFMAKMTWNESEKKWKLIKQNLD
jgi:hypothetical protein